MKRTYTHSFFAIFVLLFSFNTSLISQLSLPLSGVSATINFENSVTTVNNGTYTATAAPSPMPAAGGISSNAWTFTGHSDGTVPGAVGANDLARGTDAGGGVTTGGVYAFTMAMGADVFLGIQPAGTDFTPGTITLTVTNNTGADLTGINISYELWVNNDQARANSFNLAVSSDGNAYTSISAFDFTSTAVADAFGFLAIPKSGIILLPTTVPDGGTFYIRWNTDDDSGSGSRDEFGIDDIVVSAASFCAGSAGANQIAFVDEVIQLNATGFGEWSGGAGAFSNINDPNATYTPDASEANSQVELTWTTTFNDNVYNVNRSIGTDGTVVGTITTDGTIGSISLANIVAWDLTINDGVNTHNLVGPDDFNSIDFGFASAVTVSANSMFFNFNVDAAAFAPFQSGSNWNLWCLSTTGACGYSATDNVETVQVSDINNYDEIVLSGLVEFAIKPAPCLDAAYTTQLTIFEAPDAEFSFDPAMLCPRYGAMLPVHTSGTDGLYKYTVVDGGPHLELDPASGAIEADNSDIGTYNVTNTVSSCGNLIITGVIDGDIPGGLPKAIELYSLENIGDLSAYGLGSANNGGGSDGLEFTLPKVSLAKGKYYYVSNETTEFRNFFGFSPSVVAAGNGPASINGDDAIELYCNGIIIDVFGDPNMSGTGQAWEYTNGWAYRNNDQSPNAGTFDPSNWTFSGPDGLMDEATNAGATNPMPIKTFTNAGFVGRADAAYTFQVIVDYDPPFSESMACLGKVNVSIDPETCFANINYLHFLYGVDPDACYDYDVVIEGLSGNLVSEPGTYKVSVTSGYDGNSCWGTLVVEDKAAPVITCPPFVAVSCEVATDPESLDASGIYDTRCETLQGLPVSSNYNGLSNSILWHVGVEECSPFNLVYNDHRVNGACDGDRIVRVFSAVDKYGLTSTCEQEIYIIPEDLNDLTLPADYDCTANGGCTERVFSYGTADREEVLSCDGAGKVWNVMANGYPSPYDKYDEADNLVAFGTGKPGALGCGTVAAGFNDIKIEICGEDCGQSYGSYKILRQWTIIDWCSGGIIDHNQIIKVMDIVAPEIEKIDDLTISTSLWDCSAEYVLPVGKAKDNCSTKITVGYWTSVGTVSEDGVLYLPNSAKTMPDEPVRIIAGYADCCNNIALDTFYITVIDNVPPVVVADKHTVVSLSDLNDIGLAKLHVSSLDEGSFDNCGPVEFLARRMSGSCKNNDVPFDFSYEDDNGKYWDVLHFCCADAGKVNMIEIRVCDDANMNGIFGDKTGDIADNCNTAMVEVDVQDKLPPVCFVPKATNITCTDFALISSLVNKGTLRSSDAKKIDALFGAADGAAACRSKIEQALTSEEECGLGKVTRTVTVINTNNMLTSTCSQEITITADPDLNFLTCDDITFPEGSAEDILFRNYIKVNYTDKKDHSYDPNLIWCLMNPFNIGYSVEDGENLPAIEVMECGGVSITAPIIDIDNLCSEVGINLELDTFNFAGGGCKKILAHWEIIDQCKFVENYYIEGEINPFVPENGYFEMYVEYDLFDNTGPEITCGEGFIVGCGEELTGAITASATDACTESSFLGWNWVLKFEGDTKEYKGEGNSVAPGNIKVNNVPLVSFPEGNHTITWIVSDGCGNSSTKTCEFGLSKEDTKAPTPYCFDGLSSAIMLMNGVTLWASDFDAGSFDACTDVFVSMVPESDVVGLNSVEAYLKSLNRVTNTNTGNLEYGWNFTCAYIPNGVSATIDVRIYVTDDAGNYDFCTASFRLQDNLGACEDSEGGLSAIAGNIVTESGANVDKVEVEAMSNNPEFPKYTMTGSDGKYAFYGNPMFKDYEVSSLRNDDYLNGVSTLDLVLIQKHILNLVALDSPFKMIAADINNDGGIKASDLLQLRKLILGLYAENKLPSNDSWRFVDGSYSFSNPGNPWPFNEVISVESLAKDMMAENFVAVKIGDVNGSAVANAMMNAQTRNNKALTFEIENGNYAAGETVLINFRSSEFTNVYGYQFTLEFAKDLNFVGFEKGSLELGEANFGLNRVSEGIITTSYDNIKGATINADEVLFTLKFVAAQALEIKDVVSVSSRVTESEAYIGSTLEVNEVKVSFRTNEGIEVSENYALFQNEPNPFRGSTIISFSLPNAADATLSVYDVTGKLLFTTSAAYAKGLNKVKIDNLNTSGVLYYQLNSDDFSATKKMIVIK